MWWRCSGVMSRPDINRLAANPNQHAEGKVRRAALLCACVTVAGCKDASVDPAQEAARLQRTQERLAIINERARAVPEDQRAWPVLRDAHDAIDWPAWITSETFHGVDLAAARAAEAGSVRWIDDHRDLIDTIVAATSRPGLGYQLSLDAGMQPAAEGALLLDASSPQPTVIRALSQLLALDARLAVAEGDGARVVRNVTAMVRLAEFVNEHSLITDQLVRFALLQYVVDHVLEALTHDGVFDDEQLHTLDAQLVEILASCASGIRLDATMLVIEDAMDYVYDEDGRPLARGFETLETKADKFRRTARRDQDEQVFAEWQQAAADFLSVPAWEQTGDWPTVLRDHLNRAAARQEPAALVSLCLVPGLQRPVRGVVNVQATAGAAQIIVAARRHRLRHGAWPADLEAFDEDLLAETPIDPYDGVGLGYGLSEDGPEVWSAGEDKVDDGAVPRRGEVIHVWRTTSELQRRQTEPPPIGGDWVIFPPEAEE